jgi:PASTA domain-containing protein
MASRAAAQLPRLVVLGLAFLLGGAALTYGAAKRLSAADIKSSTTPAAAPTVVVPDLTGQAFTFAKGALEDAGFAWKVVGPVHGYAADTVVGQTPAGGTKLKDTGAPTITVRLARSSYAETGEPQDVSPYIGTAVVPVGTGLLGAVPAKTAAPAKGAKQRTTAPKTTKPAAVAPKPSTTVTKRPPAFAVPGAPKEPLKEMPLVDRAQLLDRWLSAHARPTNATVRHFLYQNAWVVTGAKFGWWHGAQALKVLIAADRKAERLWGIGHISELAARHALAEVEARTR